MNANATKTIIEPLANSIKDAQKWQEKMLALDILEKLIESAPVQFTYRVAQLLPVISEAMWDTKKEVKTRAYTAMYVLNCPIRMSLEATAS